MLTHENYFSAENMKKYMSVSQFKDFAGTMYAGSCEASALAKLNGEMPELFEPSDAMMVGLYVDSYFSGTLPEFKAKQPGIFTLKGELKAAYQMAENVIRTAENDAFFMRSISGEKQKIFTAELFGIEWKVMVDSYEAGIAITDLKVMKSIRELIWIPNTGKVSFIDAYGYDIQGAIYQKVVEIATGEKLPFFIAAITKEKYPDKAVIHLPQDVLDRAIEHVEKHITRVVNIKNGVLPAVRCESCDYCRATKKLECTISYYDLC